jgi:hypothetical protein
LRTELYDRRLPRCFFPDQLKPLGAQNVKFFQLNSNLVSMAERFARPERGLAFLTGRVSVATPLPAELNTSMNSPDMPADEFGESVLGICRGVALEQFAIGCHIHRIEPARPESAQKFTNEPATN